MTIPFAVGLAYVQECQPELFKEWLVLGPGESYHFNEDTIRGIIQGPVLCRVRDGVLEVDTLPEIPEDWLRQHWVTRA